MQEEKHIAALTEVRETIDESIRDPRGLLPRQRRLMAALSLGTQHLTEIWLHKVKAIKPGAIVKHEWFCAEDHRLRIRMAGILTKDITHLENASKILEIARTIERGRNDIVYGASLRNDSILREKIDWFLELKKEIESVVGEITWM